MCTWTVLPRPISSARIPFKLLLYKDTSHRNPFNWYLQFRYAQWDFENTKIASIISHCIIYEFKILNFRRCNRLCSYWAQIYSSWLDLFDYFAYNIGVLWFSVTSTIPFMYITALCNLDKKNNRLKNLKSSIRLRQKDQILLTRATSLLEDMLADH